VVYEYQKHGVLQLFLPGSQLFQSTSVIHCRPEKSCPVGCPARVMSWDLGVVRRHGGKKLLSQKNVWMVENHILAMFSHYRDRLK
jgi:hypothetical protein